MKLNHLFDLCDAKVKAHIIHCMGIPGNWGLKMALKTLDTKLG